MNRLAPLVVVGLAAFLACSNRDVHPFIAWSYDIDRDCLESPSAVDVLNGPDDGPCNQLRCWESPSHNIYVTDTQCNAPPDFKNETNEASGACSAALNVYGRTDHGVCPAGTGGSSGGT